MKNWILCIVRVRPVLTQLENQINKIIEKKSMDLTTDTMTLINQIVSLNNKKILIANFGVLYKEIERRLNAEDFFILKSYAYGASTMSLSLFYKAGKTTAADKLNKIVNKAVRVVARLGYNTDLLKDEYYSLPPVREIYKKILSAQRLNFVEREAEYKNRANA